MKRLFIAGWQNEDVYEHCCEPDEDGNWCHEDSDELRDEAEEEAPECIYPTPPDMPSPQRWDR